MEHLRHPSNETLKQDISAELEQRLDNIERRPELLETHAEQQEQAAEKAREQIAKQPEVQAKAPETTPKLAPPPSRLDRWTNYIYTLKSLQRSLPAASRAFSKVIHQPIISKTSEIAEATVMRPSVALGATLTAAIVGGFALLISRIYGYELPTSWFVLCLGVGAVLGLAGEAIARLLKPRG